MKLIADLTLDARCWGCESTGKALYEEHKLPDGACVWCKGSGRKITDQGRDLLDLCCPAWTAQVPQTESEALYDRRGRRVAGSVHCHSASSDPDLHGLSDRCPLLDGTTIDIHEAHLLDSRATCPNQRRVAHHDGQCFGSGDRYVEPVAVEQELHAPRR